MSFLEGEIIYKECIKIGSSAKNKKQVLEEISQLSKNVPILKDYSEKKIFNSFLEREKVQTTGIGDEIALPHCRLEDINEFIVGVLIEPNGIDFSSLDKKKCKIFVFIIGPTQAKNEYIHLLSVLSRIIMTPEFKEKLLKNPQVDEIYNLIKSHLEKEEKIIKKKEYSLFHIFVQREEKFQDILEILSAIPACSFSIIEAHDITRYIYSIPLYAGFGEDYRKGFNNIIVGLIPKNLVNETYRQIDNIVGGINKKPGILVIIQDIFFNAGSLE